jgi:phosphoglycolate phosphatase-like HAD superfamily hydrolase
MTALHDGIVVIWDLDETLIIFDSLRDGSFAARNGHNEEEGQKLGKSISKMLMEYLDGVFHYQNLEELVMSRCLVSTDSTEKNTGEVGESPTKRHRLSVDRNSLIAQVSERYSAADHALAENIPMKWFQARDTLLLEIESYTGNWLKEASFALAQVEQRGGLNIIVTASHVISALGKLKFFKLDRYFSPSTVFSAAHQSKIDCFEEALCQVAQLRSYTPEVQAVGDGPEEAAAAAHFEIPFRECGSIEDLRSIVDDFRCKDSPRKGSFD